MNRKKNPGKTRFRTSRPRPAPREKSNTTTPYARPGIKINAHGVRIEQVSQLFDGFSPESGIPDDITPTDADMWAAALEERRRTEADFLLDVYTAGGWFGSRVRAIDDPTGERDISDEFVQNVLKFIAASAYRRPQDVWVLAVTCFKIIAADEWPDEVKRGTNLLDAVKGKKCCCCSGTIK